MKLCDIVFKEYLAIIDYIKGKFPIENDRIVINCSLFYEFLDANLYLQRRFCIIVWFAVISENPAPDYFNV